MTHYNFVRMIITDATHVFSFILWQTRWVSYTTYSDFSLDKGVLHKMLKKFWYPKLTGIKKLEIDRHFIIKCEEIKKIVHWNKCNVWRKEKIVSCNKCNVWRKEKIVHCNKCNVWRKEKIVPCNKWENV